MKQIIRFLAATILGVASFAASAPLFAQQGYVHEVSGNVVGQFGAGQPLRVEKGQTLSPNTTVTTEAKSYAVLKFEDGTVVLLKENTSFQVQSYAFNPKAPENANAVFNLVRGGLRMITGLMATRNREAMRVATPHATIGIRGTEFTAELVNPLFVATQVGAISLTNAAGTVLVAAGQVGSVLGSTTLPSLISLTQLPAGVLGFPNVPLPPPTPAPITGVGGAGTAGAVGGGAAGATAGVATAAIVGAAVAAGVVASSNNSSTTTHHPQ